MPATTGGRDYHGEMVVFAVTFLFLFMAYSGIQNVETSLNKDHGLGSVSLGLIYGFLVLAGPWAPRIVEVLGACKAMLLGISGYWLYIACNAVSSPFLLICASVYLGVCASILWVAQSIHLTKLARAHAVSVGVPQSTALGQFSGTFWGIFAVNQVGLTIFGNLITFLVCKFSQLLPPLDASSPSARKPLHLHIASATIATVSDPSQGNLTPAVRLALIATFLLCLLVATVMAAGLLDVAVPEEKPEAVLEPGSAAGRPSDPLLASDSLVAVDPAPAPLESRRPSVLCNGKLLLLLPLIVYSGFESAFISGDFTLYIVKPALGVAWIGGFMAVYGLSNCLTCIVAARVSHRLPTMVGILVLGSLCQIAVLLAVSCSVSLSFWAVLTASVLWGVGDAAYMSQINAVIPVVLPDDMDEAFAQWKMWASGASCLMFLCSPLFSLHQKSLCLTILSSAALPFLCMLLGTPTTVQPLL